MKHSHQSEFAAQKLEGLGLRTGSIAHDLETTLPGLIAHAEFMLDHLRPPWPSHHVQAIPSIAMRSWEIVHEVVVYNEGGESRS